MAKTCLGCHAVPNEQLVNKAGHKDGSANFELASWVSGDVAHNLFMDPKRDAPAPSLWMAETGRKPAERKRMQYILGKMADLEVSLRYLAAAKEDGTYSQAMANRARSAAGNLDDVKEIVPELTPVADAFKKIKLKLKPENKDALLELADKVAAAASVVENKYDGTNLKDLDDLIPKMGNGRHYASKVTRLAEFIPAGSESSRTRPAGISRASRLSLNKHFILSDNSTGTEKTHPVFHHACGPQILKLRHKLSQARGLARLDGCRLPQGSGVNRAELPSPAHPPSVALAVLARPLGGRRRRSESRRVRRLPPTTSRSESPRATR